MPKSKSVLLCGLVAVGLSACASTSKPTAAPLRRGGLATVGLYDQHAKIDDPRASHFACLKQAGLPVTEPSLTEIQVGQPGVGPLIRFVATPGLAQGVQISGNAQSAEVIGNALVYPNQTTSLGEMQTIEGCAAIGVKG
jgi:hypothetical protein